MAVINADKTKFEELLAGDKPVMADFWAPWCGYCRRIAPAYGMLAEQFEDKVVAVKINIDDEVQISDKYGIEIIPTVMIFKNGKPVGQVINPPSKAALEAFITETLEK